MCKKVLLKVRTFIYFQKCFFCWIIKSQCNISKSNFPIRDVETMNLQPQTPSYERLLIFVKYSYSPRNDYFPSHLKKKKRGFYQRHGTEGPISSWQNVWSWPKCQLILKQIQLFFDECVFQISFEIQML